MSDFLGGGDVGDVRACRLGVASLGFRGLGCGFGPTKPDPTGIRPIPMPFPALQTSLPKTTRNPEKPLLS